MSRQLHLAATRGFKTILCGLTLFSLLGVGAHASTTVNTTVTINGTGTTSNGSVSATGTVTFSGGLVASGTFSASASVLTLTSGTVPVTLTITTGSTTGTLTGTLTASLTLLAQVLAGDATASGPGTIAITGGTEGFANTTGNFNVTATGTGKGTTSSGSGTFTITGPGTLTIPGGNTGFPVPTVTDVINNYSFTPAGFPNSGVAPGSIILIKGSGLADPAAQAVLQSSAGPNGIPLTLNGASISVTVGSTTVHPGIYYAIAGQIAAELPSNTPTGTASMTASYNNTPSASFSFQVVPSALGIGTYNGLAIATNATDYSLYSYTKSAKPGDVLVLWGAGLGAITADSDTVYTSAPHAIGVMPTIYIGGIQANVLYAGDSGYPGLNQIDVVVPQTVTPGCQVSLVAVSGAGANLVPSNTTAIAVDPSGATCSDSILGTTGTILSTLAGQATVKTGSVFLFHAVSPAASGGTETHDIAEASFQSTTGASYTGSGLASLGSCSLSQTEGTSTSTNTGLDAGTITVTGPSGSATLAAIPGGLAPGVSVAELPSGFIPTSGGAFTFKGSGGANVGSFSAPLTFPNPLLSWTNQLSDATVSRASGFDVTWTGGAPGSFVEITGTSEDPASGVSGSFSCLAPVSAGTFHVPNFVTLSLPGGTGSIDVANFTSFSTFAASGIDIGLAFGGTETSINATYN